jgi:hypothetical protein
MEGKSMSRTRLDEIVDDVFREAFGGRVFEDGMREIAERAFRHGVDQVPTVWGTRYVNVQPAPAEEKCGCDAQVYCRYHYEHRKASQTEPFMLQRCFCGAKPTRIEWCGAPPQPAPTEEKGRGTPPKGYYDRGETYSDGRPVYAYESRKGERRGGPLKRWSGELHGMTMFYGKGLLEFSFVVDYSGGYYRCRRSGLDRRKAKP